MTVVILSTGETRVFTETSFQVLSRYQVAQHPVDNAVDSSDNVEIQPKDLRVDIFESNQRFGAVAQPDGAQTFVAEAEAFWEQAEAELLAVTLPGLGLFTPYVVSSLDRGRGDAIDRLVYSVTLRQFVVAAATTVRVPPSRTNNTGGPDRQLLGQEAGNNARDGIVAGFLKQVGLLGPSVPLGPELR